MSAFAFACSANSSEADSGALRPAASRSPDPSRSTPPAHRDRSRAPILPRVARVRRRGSRPPYAPRAPLGDLGSRANAHAGGLGSAREHADARRSGTGRGVATLGRIAHEKFVDGEIGTLLERLGSLRGVTGVRLGRREPDSRDTSRLGKGEARPDRAPHRDAPSWGAGTPGLGRRPHEQRLRRFLPTLERNLELKRRYAECFDWDDSPYTRSWTTSSR